MSDAQNELSINYWLNKNGWGEVSAGQYMEMHERCRRKVLVKMIATLEKLDMPYYENCFDNE